MNTINMVFDSCYMKEILVLLVNNEYEYELYSEINTFNK
jgi:hypothetical protein